MKARLIFVLLIGLSACIRFDVFVWEADSISDPTTDMMAKSIVPAELRKEIFSADGGIVSADGTIVDAYLLTHSATDGTTSNPNRNGVALLYCHGQANNIQDSVPRYDALWSQGYTVLAVDQRGFGKTLGKPTDPGVYADTEAAYDWLAAQTGLKAAIYGRSLGTAMCLKAAVVKSAPALVLESPISSIQTIINESTTLTLPSDYFVDSQLNNTTVIPGYTGDLLIMHGSADTYVPPQYGEQLHSLATKAAVNTFWSVPGADHDTVPCTSSTHATVDNDCVGGQSGFSSAYFDHVNALYDATFNL